MPDRFQKMIWMQPFATGFNFGPRLTFLVHTFQTRKSAHWCQFWQYKWQGSSKRVNVIMWCRDWDWTDWFWGPFHFPWYYLLLWQRSPCHGKRKFLKCLHMCCEIRPEFANFQQFLDFSAFESNWNLTFFGMLSVDPFCCWSDAYNWHEVNGLLLPQASQLQGGYLCGITNWWYKSDG
jgi:hypothetical protein